MEKFDIKNRIIKPLSFLSERHLAIVAIMFPAAYFIEYIISQLQNEKMSPPSMFGIWYLLLALRFPILFPLSLTLSGLAFVSAALIQIFNIDQFKQISAVAGFALLIFAIFQMIILSWQEKQKQ